MSGVIVTWRKAGLVAAFVEEHRELVATESRLATAFAGSMAVRSKDMSHHVRLAPSCLVEVMGKETAP